MAQYEYLDEEIKARNYLKRKYTKLSNIFLGTEIFLIVFELGLTGNTIAVPVITPVSAPIVVALTTCSTVLKSVGRLISRKTSKHSEIVLLARSKLNSLEKKFNKAINDEEITEDEFNDIQQEIKNYESMKLNIQNEYKFTDLNTKKKLLK
jgi:CRISPR/Cas system CMR subunit Cmr4 (Cas7 group RAMP superfamily)